MRKFLRTDKIKAQSTRCRRMIEIDENFLTEALKLKRQRLIIDLKFINFDIYHDKSFKKFKDWTRNALNAFKTNFSYFFSKWIKISWAQQFIRDTSLQHWNNKKILKIIQKTWKWKNFSNFLIDFIKNLQNQCFIVVQKHDTTK